MPKYKRRWQGYVYVEREDIIDAPDVNSVFNKLTNDEVNQQEEQNVNWNLSYKEGVTVPVGGSMGVIHKLDLIEITDLETGTKYLQDGEGLFMLPKGASNWKEVSTKDP